MQIQFTLEENRLLEQTESLLDQLSIADPSVFRTSSGLVLKLKPVSRLLIAEIGRKIPDPRPPIVMIEDKGRMEENPNDPDYKQALMDVSWKRGDTVIAVYLTLGTTVVEVPDGMQKVDNEEWLETLEFLGLEVAKSPRARYLAWLKYYALSDEDLTKITQAVMRYSGVTLEADVQESVASFRSDTQGDTNNGVPAT